MSLLTQTVFHVCRAMYRIEIASVLLQPTKMLRRKGPLGAVHSCFVISINNAALYFAIIMKIPSNASYFPTNALTMRPNSTEGFGRRAIISFQPRPHPPHQNS